MVSTRLTGLPARLSEAFGKDSGHTVAKRLALAGHPISAQSVYKWLRGGNVSDDALAAVARVYDYSEAWLKYGALPKRPLTELQQTQLELSGLLPDDLRIQALDMIAFLITRTPGLVEPDVGTRILACIAKIKTIVTLRNSRNAPRPVPAKRERTH